MGCLVGARLGAGPACGELAGPERAPAAKSASSRAIAERRACSSAGVTSTLRTSEVRPLDSSPLRCLRSTATGSLNRWSGSKPAIVSCHRVSPGPPSAPPRDRACFPVVPLFVPLPSCRALPCDAAHNADRNSFQTSQNW